MTAVCCATRGEAGEPPAGSGLGFAELGVAREAELRAAADILGVTDVRVLGFVDSGMNGVAGPRTLVGARFDDVVEQVHEAVSAFGPDVLVTLDAGDGHRDHARVRDAAGARRPRLDRRSPGERAATQVVAAGPGAPALPVASTPLRRASAGPTGRRRAA